MHRSTDKISRFKLSISAFTLLEMVLSVALTSVLAVAAFTLTNGALQMGAEIGDDQKRTLLVQRCLEIFRNQMESLPGNARFELLGEDTGTDSLSELRIYDVPELFQAGGILQRSDVVSIISEESESSGRGTAKTVALNLRYDVFDESGNEVESRFLALMTGLAAVQWRCYSQVDEDWVTEWEENQGRPRFIELTLEFADGFAPIRTVFWLPPVVNPQDVIAGAIRGNQARGQQQGEGDGEGPPDTGAEADRGGPIQPERQDQNQGRNQNQNPNRNRATQQNR